MSKRAIIIVSILSLAVIATGIPLCVVYLSPKSDPLYVAHRGYSIDLPDNSSASFAAAAATTFWGIETDIRATADGVLICSHDDLVKYADGTALSIKDNTLATLLAKPLANDKTTEDAHLCTFAEYLTICQGGDKVAVVELKDHFSNADLALVLADVDTHYTRAKCIFIAFDYDNLTRLKALDAALALQYLSSTKNDPNLDVAIQEGISLDVHYSILTKKLVRKAHDKGLKVNVWTVDSNVVLGEVRRKGVDYVTSNKLHEN